KTLLQYVMRLSTNAGEREAWFGVGQGTPDNARLMLMLARALEPVGEWVLFRLDDSPVFERLVRLAERMEEGGNVDVDQVAREVWSMPIAFGMDVRNPLTFAGTLTALRTSVQAALPGAVTWQPLEKEYQGVSIVRVQATPAGRQMTSAVWGNQPEH